MWWCRGFPQCADVSQIKGNSSVRNQQQQGALASMLTIVLGTNQLRLVLFSAHV